ncbi:dynamin, partial [Penicillium sp. IBT 18751x]
MASIIPDSDAEDADASKLKDWRGRNLQFLDAETFSTMMTEGRDIDIHLKVHILTGVSRSKDDGLPTFSKHVLRVEICGPQEDHMSVIDVPKIFRNVIPGKSTRDHITLVRETVQAYMINPRSIILTLVPANVDIATQEIVEMAHELDPDGERTLGVLTKPDLVDKGAEENFIDLIRGKDMQSRLGWVTVRNLGQSELWRCTSGCNLRRASHKASLVPNWPWTFWNRCTKRSYSGNSDRKCARPFHRTQVRSEVSKNLKTRQVGLASLGPERNTKGQQVQYLLGIVSSFQNLTMQALGAKYSSNDALRSQLRMTPQA